MLKFKRDTFVRRGDGTLVSLADLGTLEHIGPLRDTLPVIGRDFDARPSQIPDAGTGVYTTRVFAKGEIVSWYSGAIIKYMSPKSLTSALRSHARALSWHRYTILGNVMEDGRHMVTDMRGRGAVPFMNDARGARKLWQRDRAPAARGGAVVTANAEFNFIESARNEQMNLMVDTPDPHERIVVAIATRSIAVGEEVFIDYDNEYWLHGNDAPGPIGLADVPSLLV